VGRRRKHPKHKPKRKWYQKENDWGDYVFDFTWGLGEDTIREIIAILVLILAVVVFLGFFDFAGSVGLTVAAITHKMFGSLPAYIFSIILFWFGVTLLFPEKNKTRISKFIGLFLLVVFFSAFMHLFVPELDARNEALVGNGGGIVGYMISDPLNKGLGLFVSFLVVLCLMVISIMMIFNVSIKQYLGLGKEEEDKKDDKVKVNRGASYGKSLFNKIKMGMKNMGSKKKNDEGSSKAPVIETELKPIRPDADWKYPPVSILVDSDDVANPGNIQKNVDIVVKTLSHFGIKVYPGDVNIGPTVTQYTFKPDEGVKLSNITARNNDLALALASKSLRIEAPIPGKSSIGIENPNKIPAKVTLKEVITSKEFKSSKGKLSLALGRDVAGASMVIDLEKMPHMLIAGATGSGKSVCINSVITTLLFNNSPNELKLILIDPKRVELTNYNEIPHLLTQVITEVDKTVSALKWAIWEMERRYKLFSEAGKRNVEAYNAKPGEEGKLPYIVIIIDELADLMAMAANDIEGSIVRLAQMARATGIHLIVATQRPSVDVLTGLIKANITSRLAFATASQVDSRTILDLSGAEKLLGNGDMLFIGNGLSKPKRVQGCFVSDKEIEELVGFLKDASEPQYDDSVLDFKATKGAGGTFGVTDADDDLYDDAVKLVTEAGKASASLLQRRLRVGYARAARLLDILEDNGVVGPQEGAKPRDVLIGAAEASKMVPTNGDNAKTDDDNIHFGNDF